MWAPGTSASTGGAGTTRSRAAHERQRGTLRQPVSATLVRPPLLEPAACPPPPFEIPGGAPMTTGTVKKLVSERGFGFITAEDGKEYFFHRSALAPSLDFDR